MTHSLTAKGRYRRNLPHLCPAQGLYFVTFNLYGAHPRVRRADSRTAFGDMERALHHPAPHSPRYLARADIAGLVLDAVRRRDGRAYRLDCVTVMPNHVHLVFSMAGFEQDPTASLARVLHGLKGYTGRMANRLLGRTGRFWQKESFDRAVRHLDEWRRCVAYTLDNPVKAGLVSHPEAWPWTWCRPIAGLYPPPPPPE